MDLLKLSFLTAIDNINAGNSHMTEEQCEEAIDFMNRMLHAENKYSKYQAYNYLHLSRATFDRYVKDGLIPEGRKESGFTEKFWYKRDLDQAKLKLKNKK